MSQTEFNCNKCDLKDTDRMVQCDLCDKWFHFECVGVNSDVANVSWNCSCGKAQPVAMKKCVPTTTRQANTLPPVNATADFSAGLQAASSPTNHISRPFSDAPGPSKGVYTVPPPTQPNVVHTNGAYKKAQQHEIFNTGVSGDSVTAPAKVVTTASQQFIQCGPNMSNGSLSAHTQLQLQMLEEEKELQRKYLEKKYNILSQGDLSQNMNSFFNQSSFQPTASQIAARQVIPKELPKFDGNPEDWPLFISNYKNSTEIAGYSDCENLIRLQSCLKSSRCLKCVSVVQNIF